VSATYYLNSPDAKKEGSEVRQIIESGHKFIQNNNPDEIASVLYACCLLGGSTLKVYKDTTKGLPTAQATLVEKLIEKSLTNYAGFDERYAKWLPRNLHRLQSNSYQFVQEYGKDAADLVRYSLVAKFDYSTELRKFKAYIGSATKGMAHPKQTLLEEAIERTSDSSISIDLKSLYSILKSILIVPTLTKEIKDLLTGETLDKWLSLIDKH
jgi:hypothetical protein